MLDLRLACLVLAVLQVDAQVGHVNWWKEQLAKDPNDVNARACLGLATFRSGDVPRGLMHLMPPAPHDWVAMEHVAAGQFMMGNRMLSASGDKTTVERTFSEAARWFGRAAEARESTKLHGPSYRGGAAAPTPASYPQKDFAHPRAQVYRSWGDALSWLGQDSDALAVYQRGVEEGIWSTPWCRPSPKALPVIPQGENFFFPSSFFHPLAPVTSQAFLSTLAEELAASLQVGLDRSNGWRNETAGLHSGHSWQVLPLMVNGRMVEDSCTKWPRTCRSLRSISAFYIRDGQVKISLMQPGTVVRAHAGPTNGRLRMHCSISVPEVEGRAVLRVGNETVSWRPNECLVFNEACDHSVHIDATLTSPRIVLIADFVNPFLLHPTDFEAQLSAPKDHRPFIDEWLRTRHRAREEL